MLARRVISAFRVYQRTTSILTPATTLQNLPKTVSNVVIPRTFSTLLKPISASTLNVLHVQHTNSNLLIPARTVTKYSLKKGKRKTVKAVLRRFYRLHWGGWIRTKCGRHKSLWKKSPPRKRRLRQHVLCNATQSTLLDKMVNAYWKKRKFYVEDPYEPYHSREEFRYAAIKPRPYFPPEK